MAHESETGTDVTPEVFLRALLKISPEDAEKVRDNVPVTRKRGGKGQDGPTADYGKAESTD